MNHRRHRASHQRQTSTLNRERIEELAAFGARLMGCECDYELSNVRHSARNVADATVGHDDDCPARDAGRQTLVTLDAHRAGP